MQFPRVAIIILNWNGLKDTIPCIDSLNRCTYSSMDIIVVDNASTGNDVDVLASRYGDAIHIVRSDRNLGFAGGNNLGIEAARKRGADHVLLLNNDTEVDPKFVEPLVAGAQAGVGIVASKMYYFDPPGLIWYAGGRVRMFGFNRHVGINKHDGPKYDRPGETDYAPFASVLITKEALDRVGGLSEEYFLQWEDIDYCLRAREAGLVCVYEPRSRIWHKVSRSSTGGRWTYRKLWHGMRGRVLLRKRLLSMPFYLFYLAYFYSVTVPVHSAYYLLVRRDPRLIPAMLGGAWSAIRGAVPEELMDGRSSR